MGGDNKANFIFVFCDLHGSAKDVAISKSPLSFLHALVGNTSEPQMQYQQQHCLGISLQSCIIFLNKEETIIR